MVDPERSNSRKSLKSIAEAIQGRTLFLGAGVSIPSGIPGALSLQKLLLNLIGFRKEEIYKYFKIGIPFERFIEVISPYIDFEAFISLFRLAKMNWRHKLIAELAKKGVFKTIITTNFDLCMEQALEFVGMKRNSDFEVVHRDEDFRDLDNSTKLRLMKIHGCSSDPEGMKITLSQIAKRKVVNSKIPLLERIFGSIPNNGLLIIGYSGSDHFDINPFIIEHGNSRKNILYITHKPISNENEKPLVIPLEQSQERFPFNKFKGLNISVNTDYFLEIVAENFDLKIGNGQEETFDVSNIISKSLSGLTADQQKKRYLRGLIYVASGLYEDALREFSDTLDHYRKVRPREKRDKEGMMKVLGEMGNCYFYTSNYDEAQSSYLWSLRLSSELKHEDTSFNNYLHLGAVYRVQRKWGQSEKYLLRALEASKNIGNHLSRGASHLNLGILYSSKEDFGKAMDQLKSSIRIARRIGNQELLARCFGAKGDIYYREKLYKTAIRNHKKALNLYRLLGEKIGEVMSLENLSINCERSGDLEASRQYGLESKRVKELTEQLR